MTLLLMLLACGEDQTTETEPTTPVQAEAPVEEPPAEEPAEETEESTEEVPTLEEAPQLGAPKLGAGGMRPLGGGPPRLGGTPMQPGGLKAPSLGGGSAPKKSQ